MGVKGGLLLTVKSQVGKYKGSGEVRKPALATIMLKMRSAKNQ